MICFSFNSEGQSSYIHNGHNIYHHLDRLDVLYQINGDIHSSFKPYARSDVRALSKNHDCSSMDHNDHILQHYFMQDLSFLADSLYESQKGFLKSFYKSPAHFFEIKEADFSLVINPILNFQIGYESENDDVIFLNKRGIELYGTLDEKLYFYTNFHENQSNFLNYITPFIDKYKAIPGQGNYKPYQSAVFEGASGFDYSNAQAYLGYKISKHSLLELGHNKQFVGNGMRSLLLGDSGQNYFYLKFNVRFWKIEYQSLFTELSSISARQTVNTELLPKKYMASHYLSFKPSKKFEIGLFESVVYSRENHFEFQYLNPVILYRTAEHYLDSPDNVLIGLNGKWNIFSRISLYGQFVLDEFNFSEFFDGTNWWGNKYGIQAGLKYFNVLGVKNLDLQTEFNRVRPYTYSHFQESEEIQGISVSSYSHFYQPLAHPLGANFSEVIFKLRYQPTRRLILEGRYLYTVVGRDNNTNFGSDILLLNTTRTDDYGILQHQGARSEIQNLSLDMSYELFYNFFIDLQVMLRKDTNLELGNTNTTFINSGIRYNIHNTKIDY